ncbi:Transglutaminase-like enzyme, putative cysteine protease [Albimonas donghaensis]|uniref:Transglutaminase-like enzyme, putative cysteine protease n=1 Tax=Albimonas donghaensis TaxID=356660 RepID=A0A1H3AKB7_9RHOB|nr:transglutaminase family protein [Albimonas donghaensis]SDX29614.1 Transglutaminase-like enzyme, putative cysteine protease [Albimonas donghaensis]
MRLRLGCRIAYDLAAPTPIIALLNVHPSRESWLEQPDRLRISPAVPVESYRDGFGNWCARFVAPQGRVVISTDGIIHDDGQPDPQDREAGQSAVEDLPAETIQFLLGSRYCDTDRLMDEAWRLFQHTKPGWERVQAICEFVNGHITFGYEHARPTRTAWEAYNEGVGVCRDYAHLAVAFCRCLNIPARYCNGIVSDVGEPPPYAPMDFAAYMEVWLGGRWHVFDPRNLKPRIGRVLVARGRDAADVPLTQSFGPANLAEFAVWIDPLSDPMIP